MSEPAVHPAKPDRSPRQDWIAVLARASHADMLALVEKAALPTLPTHAALRGPECGLVMVRGRAGGGGGAFNLGEMSVTRCTVRDQDGRIGHAYVAGRDRGQAELAARLDALLQDPDWHAALHPAVIVPLIEAQSDRRAADARRAAATRVDFFTLATMRGGA